MCAYVGVCGCVQVCAHEHRCRGDQRQQILWSWSYRQLLTTCHGCWAWKLRPLQEQYVLVTAKASQAPKKSLFLYFNFNRFFFFCLWTCSCICENIPIEARDQYWSFVRCGLPCCFVCLFVERRSLSLAWGWPNKLGQLVSESQESLSAGIISVRNRVQ